MSEHETAEAINEQAMRWVAVLDREGRNPARDAELAAWLAGDTRRQGAFLRAEAAWNALDRARLLSDAPAAQPSRRRLLVGGGALAASVVAGAGGWLAYRAARTIRIETAKGEIRRVPLSDGSLAIVNTGSDVKVELAADLRAVRLGEGEAWFEVARDKARPFVVAAGDVRVRALGTAFSIRRMDRGAMVQVSEGVVEAWCASQPDRIVHIASGSRAYVAPNSVPAVATKVGEEIDRNLAWRTGLIILDGDTLGEAAAEFNRYNDAQIVIEDRELASQTYVGRFRTNEPGAFVNAVALTLGTGVRTTPDGFIIYRE